MRRGLWASGKSPPFKKQNRAEDETGVASSRPLLVAGEQLLGDRVAVVVSKDVNALDTELGEEHLLERRLVEHRIRLVAGLVRPAEAEHVRSDDAKACSERRPHRVPVPGRAREAVDREEHRASAFVSVEDVVPRVTKRLAVAPPALERVAVPRAEAGPLVHFSSSRNLPGVVLQVADHRLQIVVDLGVHDERAHRSFALADLPDKRLGVGDRGVGAAGELGDVVDGAEELRLLLGAPHHGRGAVQVGQRLLCVVQQRDAVALEVG